MLKRSWHLGTWDLCCLFCWVPGCLVSIWVPVHQNAWESGFLGIWAFGHLDPGPLVPSHLGAGAAKCLGTWEPWYLGTCPLVSGFLGAWPPGPLGAWTPEHLGSKAPG